MTLKDTYIIKKGNHMTYFKITFMFCLSTILMSSQAPLIARYSQSFTVNIEDCQKFPSNWSLAPEEVYYALKYATYKDTFQILEFGAGTGTVCLSELLQKLGVAYEYHTYENCSDFVSDLPHVTFHHYTLPTVQWHELYKWHPAIQALKMAETPIADLVIVDGPHGVARANWYSKFKHLTRPGTIILIDDFHHYAEFGKELDKNFVYETIIEYNHNDTGTIVNNGLEHIDGVVHKCFKIVQVIQVK